ncbi:hypothetical protein CPT_Stills18 [Bacillus phage Stills]|uniref:Uncharacterized protein n=1 Tax=Bacillus phage Stills TaxID=1610833 RepID=A0A0E3T5J1_9CAUD|nr:hypothetical protein CPT_Stills18 [Bacillus phage Stills]AKC02646.1 hypothetical protein CPT_Stills18 [Bacillus phage Stills]
MEILDLTIKILAAGLAVIGALGGTVFLTYAMKHISENKEASETFDHDEDMGACIEYIMYMVTSIFFYAASIVGLILMVALKLFI